MLGSLHHPRRLRPRATAVLLCNPFGEEAARAHRTYRVLATQLERAGYAALRFDLSSSGDSQGDGEDASLEDWMADIGTAAERLRSVTGATRVTIVGLRLGATLAIMASGRGDVQPRHVVLWDPIVDGAAYLRELASNHQAYMRAELGKPRAPARIRTDGTPTESLGAPISVRLAAELATIDLARTPPAESMTVVTTRPARDFERVRKAWPASTRWLEMTDSPAWSTDAALNAMTVPMDIVQAIVAQIEETSP